MNRRYCAVFLPLLSADNWLRDHPGKPGPRVFVTRMKGAMRVVAVDEVAEMLGLTPGMTLADARARVPEVESVAHDPTADARLLDEIAEGCDRFTPSVALDPPDGLVLDITGCTHLWEGEAGLVSALAAYLVKAGLTLRLALGDTPDQARALARYGGDLLRAGRKIPPQNIHDTRPGYQPPVLAPVAEPAPMLDVTALPLRALGLGATQTTALRRAGLVTLGDLATRPRAPLAARFGQDAVTRLTRILGEDDARITPRRLPPALTVSHRFAEPVARTAFIEETLRRLAAEAVIALAERQEGGRDFGFSLYRSDGAVHRLRIETGQASRDPDLICRLFAERIETLADPLDPGFGYDMMRLDIFQTEPLAPAQSGFEEDSAPADALALLTDRLSVRLGTARVRRFAAGDSHIPECAGFTTPAQRPVSQPASHPMPDMGEPPRRPLQLLDPPQIVDVIAEVPDGPPRRFRWRKQTHDITAFEGPERLSAEWWKRRDGAGLTRDYYRVEDSQGRRFWLFRHGLYGTEKINPDWYVHGLFG